MSLKIERDGSTEANVANDIWVVRVSSAEMRIFKLFPIIVVNSA